MGTARARWRKQSMKLATFIIKATGKKTIGVYQNDRYLDVVALDSTIPNSMQEVLAVGADALQKIQNAAQGADGSQHAYSAEDVELAAPVRPGKIIHTSCNFDAHLSELTKWEATEWKEHGWDQFHFEHPTGFLEAPSCVVGSGVGIEIPRFTKQLDYEIEVGIVIGRTCKNVPVEDAMDCVAGLMIFNDVSARDIQAREHANNVILMGKSFDGSCPFGPWLVTLDELDNPNDLDMKMYLNGELRQSSNTSATHYNMAELVSWWSNMTLEPGDVITTGSPPGVISGMKNPQWMKSGDVMECHVEGLGCLVTPVL
jgi:2-keto-4-pentenoate hydratase/2-oxohepta-3-ene-1,7-dioic acid hydratase in catechol pathway